MCVLLIPHNWGKWGDAYQYSCNGGARQARSCKDCGKIQTRSIYRGLNHPVDINNSVESGRNK